MISPSRYARVMKSIYSFITQITKWQKVIRMNQLRKVFLSEKNTETSPTQNTIISMLQSFKFARWPSGEERRNASRCLRWCLPFNKAIYHRFYWLFVTAEQQIFTNYNAAGRRKFNVPFRVRFAFIIVRWFTAEIVRNVLLQKHFFALLADRAFFQRIFMIT